MNGGGGDHSHHTLLTSPAADGSDFLLQLLRRPPHQPPLQPSRGAASSTQSENLSHDPAVAAVGPSLPFPQFPSNGHDLSQHPPPWSHSPPFAPHNFFLQGFPQNPNSSPNHIWSSPGTPPQQNLPHNFRRLDDERKLGFPGSGHRAESTHQHERNIMFGTFPSEIRSNESTTNGNAAPGARFDGLLSRQRENHEVNWGFNGLENNFQNSLNSSRGLPANFQSSRNPEQDRRIGVIGGRGRPQQQQQQQSEGFRGGVSSPEIRRPPPGFQNNPGNFGKSEPGNRSFERNVNNRDERDNRFLPEHGKIRGDMPFERRLSSQLEAPGPPAGSNLHSISASDFEDSLTKLHGRIGENRLQDNVRKGGGPIQSESDELAERIEDSLVLEDGSGQKSDGKQRHKDYRSDTRGQMVLGQKMRNYKRQVRCRNDIDRLSPSFLAIYEALIPPDEEKARQKQLITLLEKLVKKEWPDARLYLYGSCANSFGVSKSDIDVCLTIEDPNLDKCEVLLKLADILQSDDLQNVQALTRARVPIVKLMDPSTGISCDICINNVLAVVNTKLLRDYAKIDPRLQQLAYIVKHWAKSRRVNETYHGTLSSYAYVLMCIHFLQQRRPAILPCLQEMDVTYAVTVDNIECSFFDQVEKLSAFGSRNRESIAQLVWGFFNYWAYSHDYTNDVISVRTGCTISKRLKDWTRRVGNDRHLICIEDPFEISHDLGRVVDKFSIKVLREEFERAAEIMQYDPNPCVVLFEPYVPS